MDAVAAFSQAGQPHNDYLRLLADYGLVESGLWALGIILIIRRLTRIWVRADAAGDAHSRFYLWALLSLIAILGSMITDNPLVYLHVQGPLHSSSAWRWAWRSMLRSSTTPCRPAASHSPNSGRGR